VFDHVWSQPTLSISVLTGMRNQCISVQIQFKIVINVPHWFVVLIILKGYMYNKINRSNH